jgi:hypothetical protein
MNVADLIEEPRPIATSAVLQRKIDAVRRKQGAVNLGTAAAITGLVVAGFLALGMVADWWWELPRWGRALVLLAHLSALAWVGGRFVVRPLRRRPDDDVLALMVERAVPGFRGRLISAVQLARPNAIPTGASPELVRALIEETEGLAAPLDFTGVIRTGRLQRLALVAATVLALGLAGYLATAQTSSVLLQRVFLSNLAVPRKTRVVDATGDRMVGRGDPVTLAATAEGIVPRSGKVFLKYASGRRQTFSLERDPKNRGRFSRVIENVPDSFTYVIRLNDGVSPEYNIVAVPRPSVASVECQQDFPAYTRLARVRRPMGDLSLLAGSKLSIAAAASKSIQRASLRLVGLDKDMPMQIDPQNNRQLSARFDIPVKGLNGFSIHLVDEQGVESKDSAVYRIDVVLDRAPAVRVLYPERKEELVTQQAALLVAFEAIDDFAIGKVALRFRSEAVESGAEKEIELDLGGQTPKAIRRRYPWKLGLLQPPLPEGSSVEYWLEVRDTNDATGPGIGASEHFVAKVVSEAEKRADLLNRVGDSLNSIIDVTQDQEKLNQNLGALILEKPGSGN